MASADFDFSGCLLWDRKGAFGDEIESFYGAVAVSRRN